MTYPHPSCGYDELVCTAGITDSGEWVRLYPIDYRYRPKEQQFRKYQWIEVDLFGRGNGNDNRKESRKPLLDSISVIGKPLSHNNGWSERRKVMDQIPVFTLNQLKKLNEQDKTSLGIVKPKRIIDLIVEDAERDWKPEWQAIYSQIRLFGDPPKPLTKIPYKFSYRFECDDDEKPHIAMIEDWELGVLFLKEAHRLGSEEKAIDSVRHNFFSKICSPQRDTLLFMGTTFPFNSWVVLGVYYPPKLQQFKLF